MKSPEAQTDTVGELTELPIRPSTEEPYSLDLIKQQLKVDKNCRLCHGRGIVGVKMPVNGDPDKRYTAVLCQCAQVQETAFVRTIAEVDALRKDVAEMTKMVREMLYAENETMRKGMDTIAMHIAHVDMKVTQVQERVDAGIFSRLRTKKTTGILAVLGHVKS
jgi:hypothetical protein